MYTRMITRKIKTFFMALMLVVSFVSTSTIVNTENVEAAVSSYVKTSNFNGRYYPQGKYESYNLILNISKIQNGYVYFSLDGSTAARELIIEKKVKIKNNKASFTYTDNWANKGKGCIVFNKDKTLKVTAKTTEPMLGARADFSFTNAKFSKKNTETYVYYAPTDCVKSFTKSNGKLTVKLDGMTFQKCNYDFMPWGKSVSNLYVWSEQTSKKQISYKLASNCKWGWNSKNDRIDEIRGKSSYTETKKDIKMSRQGEWSGLVMIYVRGGKIHKVILGLP